MADRRSEHTRKVSFAAEPRINYIYHEEANSTKTSSSVTEAPMEYTTDAPELRRPSLFRGPEEDQLGESLESLFITRSIEEYQEDPILLKEYAKRREALGRKESLDPLRALVVPQGPPGEDAADLTLRLSARADAEAHGEDAEAPERQGARRSLDASLNDTAITNSSFVVEELVNTVDLRKMVQYEPKERRDVGEYLASIGIRFLDDSIADAMRRDTLSKSRNDVDPALFYHYKYSLKERIDYLYSFSGFLGERMKELQVEIDEAQREVDVDMEGLNKEMLKKIRNEARNRSKVDWYNLRKVNELQFNRVVAGNRQRLQELLAARRRELERIEEEVSRRDESVKAMRAESEGIHRRLMQANPAELQEAEKLQQMISERMGVLEAVRGEFAAAACDLEAASSENRQLEGALAKLRAQNESLRNNLLVRSISENELGEMKRATQRYCRTFKVSFVKVTKTAVVLSIYSHVATISLDAECRVAGCAISTKGSDPVFSLAEPPTGVSDLARYVRLLVGRFIFLQALKNEIGRLQERVRVEMFSVNRQLHLRIFAGANRPFIDLAVGSDFVLSSRGTAICNVEERPEGLSAYVEELLGAV